MEESLNSHDQVITKLLNYRPDSFWKLRTTGQEYSPGCQGITGKYVNIQEGIYIPHQSKDASPHSPMDFWEMLTVMGSPPLHRVAVSVLILCGLLICVVTLLLCHCLDLACSSLIDTTLVPCSANWLLSTATHGGAKASSVDMSVPASQL